MPNPEGCTNPEHCHRRGSQNTPLRATLVMVDAPGNGVATHSINEKLWMKEMKQMKLEVTEKIEKIARCISVGKRRPWLKEMVNFQSLIGKLKQQHPRADLPKATFDDAKRTL